MKLIRIVAILVGLGTVAWQGLQWSQGNAQNMFFIPDIIVGLYLGAAGMLPKVRAALIHMFAGFGLMSGIYLVATLGTWTVTGGLDAGAISTLVGLVFTLPAMIWIARRLTAV